MDEPREVDLDEEFYLVDPDDDPIEGTGAMPVADVEHEDEFETEYVEFVQDDGFLGVPESVPELCLEENEPFESDEGELDIELEADVLEDGYTVDDDLRAASFESYEFEEIEGPTESPEEILEWLDGLAEGAEPVQAVEDESDDDPSVDDTNTTGGLEAPVERVTGFDTPYPHSLEWAYFPGPIRIGEAIDKILKD